MQIKAVLKIRFATMKYRRFLIAASLAMVVSPAFAGAPKQGSWVVEGADTAGKQLDGRWGSSQSEAAEPGVWKAKWVAPCAPPYEQFQDNNEGSKEPIKGKVKALKNGAR